MTQQCIANKDKEQKDNEEYSKHFTRIPNMVFASYKNISNEEKFLYCTLKSVYWDAKPRFVTLRELSDVTGYSRSALAKMLPRLSKCGLIAAEIKREKDNRGVEFGNSKFHITIPDIWEVNKGYYSCPPNGRDKLDPSLSLVPEKDKGCPPNGQPCPPNKPRLSGKKARVVHQTSQDNAVDEPVESGEARSKDILKDILKDSSKEEDSNTTSTETEPPTANALSSSSSSDKDLSPSEETKPANPLTLVSIRKTDPLDSLSPDIRSIIQEWLEWHEKELTISGNTIAQAQRLKALAVVPGEIRAACTRLKTNDRKGFFADVVHLGSVVNDLEAFRKLQKKQEIVQDDFQSNYKQDEQNDKVVVEADPPQPMVTPQGLTLKQCYALRRRMLEDYDCLIIGRVEIAPGLFCLALSDGQPERIAIYSVEDWEMLDQLIVNDAVEYGMSTQQQKAQ